MVPGDAPFSLGDIAESLFLVVYGVIGYITHLKVDDVYPMFHLMSYDGDVAPDEGYVTYSMPVGGAILPSNLVHAIAPYVLGLVLIVGTGAVLYRKRHP